MNKKEMEELRCSTLGGMMEVISKAHLWQAYYDANESPYILREKAEDVKEAIEEVIERLNELDMKVKIGNLKSAGCS
jgi:hypothetical protein